jgi:hypothetical protein
VDREDSFISIGFQIRMSSAWMLRRVASVRADVSEECITLNMEALRSSESSAVTRAIRRNVPADCIPHSLRGEYVTFYRVPVKLY